MSVNNKLRVQEIIASLLASENRLPVLIPVFFGRLMHFLPESRAEMADASVMEIFCDFLYLPV